MTSQSAPDDEQRRVKDLTLAALEGILARPLETGLYLVATPIGNLADMTLRAIAVLWSADAVYCEDTRHSRRLLDAYGIRRSLRAYHEHNADEVRPEVLALLQAEKTVALISDAGTPLISDPGFKLVRDAAEQGLPVFAVPGPSAVIAALTVSGLPTDGFHFAGFLPSKAGQRRERLESLLKVQTTVIVYESPQRLTASLEEIANLAAGRQLCVARELTKRFEEVRRGPADALAAWAKAESPKGEIVIVIAPASREEVDEADIEEALRQAPSSISLRDSVSLVADRLNVPRSRVYDVALALKKERRP